MNISAWSIRQPIPALVLFAVLTILGLFSFSQLPVTRFPNVDIPIISVTINQPGAAPSEIETQITKKIEDAVAGVVGIKHIVSSISDGLSTTTIEFRIEVNTDRALNDVKDAVARVRADLPRNILEPITQRVDITGLPIVTYGVSSPGMSIEQLSWFVDDVAARDLQSVRGVGGVSRIGGVDREILIELDPDRLLSLGVTAGEVSQQLRAMNVDIGGGRGELAGQEQAIRTLAGARKVEDLAQTTIVLSGGRKVKLADLGSVTDTAAEPRRFARLDGRSVVAFGVNRAKGASDVVVAADVAKHVEALQTKYPDVKMDMIDSYVDYTVGNYKSAMQTLLEGAALSVLVVLIFLRDLRATIITAIALPLSVIPTFFALDAMGFSLNLVSLLALTLATGILVDDAIVEIENIVRHMHLGKSPYRAALEAADEIGLAVIAITFTIVAVFAPVSFMGGIAGQYFKQFGLTVAVAVLFSLLVARLITPMLAAYFLRPHPHREVKDGTLMRLYTALVRTSVRHRFITVVAGLAIFAVSIMGTKLLPSGFLPAEDVARLLLSVELPPGAKIDDTMRVTDMIAKKLRERPEVTGVFVDGGKIGLGAPEVRNAQLTVHLSHKTHREKTQKQLQTEIGADVARIPDIRSWFLNDNGQRAVSLVVSGTNNAAVEQVGAELASQMKRIPLIANVSSSAALNRPEILIVPRSDRAADLGISTEALADAIRVATIGDLDVNLAKYNAGDRLLPIRVQLKRDTRAAMDILANLRVATNRGGSVPLSAVADIRLGQGPASINRYDRVRRISVEADLVGTDALGEAVDAIMALPAAKNLPAGVTLKESGDAEIMIEVFEGFAKAMGAGILMVLAVLILLFASVLQPITILFSLPLSVGGVILALIITDHAISMPVVIGMLMLMGIVTKNAIMLVDFAIEQMAMGVNRLEAIVDAGRKRARPIIMTTIAMVAGMVPSALGFGDGGEFRSPMAIGVIGGLIVSTLLSLIFVPAMFILMDDLSKLVSRLFSGIVGPTDEPETSPPSVASGHEGRDIRLAAE
ncbi:MULTISPECIES: efflux RND transporter permease subunit [unclassified Beijerinckia]|uniref:efflux RND transporter permease subunit n=1 Tax=unclassified Beijerinckia TaxID=2638183 RepID=UPI00089D9CB8|nr:MULTISPECIES: efflux RND transporter permease subunit [unclassified Beijerinckia]MDH7793967.1 hydrophobe/amphiphile efflux-1 (HAE1) family protein [Beijerinckia sp. GAS462]SEB50460.1 hydrophobe/amphiphile efflux-1 (HAE1) family protein [Beijerinckia sp. 28-YEA-48]